MPCRVCSHIVIGQMPEFYMGVLTTNSSFLYIMVVMLYDNFFQKLERVTGERRLAIGSYILHLKTSDPATYLSAISSKR